MSLSSAQIQMIDRIFQDAEQASQVIIDLRAKFPGFSLTRCGASDVEMEMPFRCYRSAELYLVDGAAHCWQLTNDPARTAGFLLVEGDA